MRLTRNVHDALVDLLSVLTANGTITHEEAASISTKARTRRGGAYTDAFEELWGLYPARLTDSGGYVKAGKAAAYNQYLRTEQEVPHGVLLSLVKAYSMAHPSGKYVKDMERWLRGKPWDDEVVTRAEEAQPAVYRTWDDE